MENQEQENLESEQIETSEVSDGTELTDEAKLAKEALEATGEEPAKTEPDPKDAVIGDFRRQLRDSQLAVARLEGQISAKQTQVTSLEKSPLELAAEAQEVSVDDVEISGALYRKQRVWEKKQDAAEAERTVAKSREELGQQSYQTALVEFSEVNVGEGLDFQTVISRGQALLTSGDKLDIANAKDPAKLAYKRCKRAILESGTEDATLLQQRIDAHKSKTKKKDEPDKDKADKKAKAEAEGGTPESTSVHKSTLHSLFHAEE